jgi:N-acetylglucosaminyldiphosphoundecaprenol N-acetyl-beta-D-mannosaminyltransferase
MAACQSAAKVCADGAPVAFLNWLLGGGRPTRITGCEIVHELFSAEYFVEKRLMLVVESIETECALVNWKEVKYPSSQWRIVVAARGLLEKSQAQMEIVDCARDFCPDIMILTLGAPVSEIFVQRYAPQLPSCWVLCVGQALRVEIGLITRAPPVLRRLGLEWLWRIGQEPYRLGHRYILDAIWFPIAILIEMCSRLSHASD